MAPTTRRVIVSGRIRPPGDKSVTHRALLVAALSPERSEIHGALTSADARSTAAVLRALGARVGPLRTNAAVRIEGGAWRAPAKTLDCGNSGTTARLLLGLLAAHPFAARLSGDASLRRRPMDRVTRPLTQMGARIDGGDDDRLPITIRGGRLQSLAYESPVASAQIKSAILFAGYAGGVDVTVREPVRSRDHTERLLRHLALPIEVDGATVTLRGSAVPRAARPPVRLEIPGDLSSAAFLIGAALLASEGELVVERVGVNPTRDGVLRVLQRMGAAIERRNPGEAAGEPVADLAIRSSRLRGTEVPAAEVPSLIDEVPILAVLASRAEGETRFHAVGELRVKESDRLGLLARNLRALGVTAVAEGDDLLVAGTDQPPRGRIETAGDHRLTMAFAVLRAVPGARIELSETRSAAVSYPTFFDDLATLAG